MEVVVTEFPSRCCLNQKRHINFLFLLVKIQKFRNWFGQKYEAGNCVLSRPPSMGLLAHLAVEEREHILRGCLAWCVRRLRTGHITGLGWQLWGVRRTIEVRCTSQCIVYRAQATNATFHWCWPWSLIPWLRWYLSCVSSVKPLSSLFSCCSLWKEVTVYSPHLRVGSAIPPVCQRNWVGMQEVSAGGQRGPPCQWNVAMSTLTPRITRYFTTKEPHKWLFFKEKK